MLHDIDRKFIISATCREHGHLHSERDAVLFLCKDKCFLPTLRFYREECERQGVDQRQLLGVDLLIGRVEKYQKDRAEMMKLPDIDATPAGDLIVAPNAT